MNTPIHIRMVTAFTVMNCVTFISVLFFVWHLRTLNPPGILPISMSLQQLVEKIFVLLRLPLIRQLIAESSTTSNDCTATIALFVCFSCRLQHGLLTCMMTCPVFVPGLVLSF